mmetsp:Transcript_9126/g.12682  ORF Transcript_9126/g.12682 Transcript_9126/m.12682 type:complete len:81 (-) Transcript_9126:19-261(-)
MWMELCGNRSTFNIEYIYHFEFVKKESAYPFYHKKFVLVSNLEKIPSKSFTQPSHERNFLPVLEIEYQKWFSMHPISGHS